MERGEWYWIWDSRVKVWSGEREVRRGWMTAVGKRRKRWGSRGQITCPKKGVKCGLARLTFKRLLDLPTGRVLALGDILEQERKRERVVVRELGGFVILGVEKILRGREEVGEGLRDEAWQAGWATRGGWTGMMISSERAYPG